jgi:hypothetical protein
MMPASSRRRFAAFVVVLAMAAFPTFAVRGAGPKFYRDDPLPHEPETTNASNVAPQDVDLIPDLLLHMFTKRGDPSPNVRAKEINTIDEVPDSSWFTNRIYAHDLTVEQVVEGQIADSPPAPGRWTLIRPKSAGFSPGFTAKDSKGVVWFLSFDPKGYPQASTAAVAVATRLFWALGYNQVESFITRIDPKQMDIDPQATISPRPGKRRAFRRDDLEAVLRLAARDADGSYRAVAGRQLPGKVVGPFKYYGTRHDDPNDIVPHEHRRSLRALKVFAAWTNLVDMKAGNTLDTVVEEDGRGIVRHYLQDVGSTFGTGATGPRDWDEGYEYLWEPDSILKRLWSFGFALSPWQTVPYQELPQIGRFEGDEFNPEAWVPRVPTPALVRARADDTFWAALRVTAFTDEQIRAAVHAGGFTDPAAEKLLGDVLIKRRDAIGRAYLAKVTPLTQFAFDGSALTFRNVATDVVKRPPPDGGYSAEWFAFDNTTGESRPLGKSDSTSLMLHAPSGGVAGAGGYLKVAVAARDSHHHDWVPVDVYFRRTGAGWTLVGLERLPDGT